MTSQDNALRIRGKLLRIASFRDEADLDSPDPEIAIRQLKARRHNNIDIFTFCQRLPDVIPKYSYFHEWESTAVLDYKNHDYWFYKILDDKTRNMVRKADKKGVIIRLADFNDDLVHGIVKIYNECPIRQGRLFKHYGKTFQEAKEANSTHLERSVFIGAFHDGRLIGFIKLVFGDRTGRAEQIISMIEHRDKAPTNALLDMAVTLCEQRNIPYLIYGIWPQKESFAQFKKNNGFTKVDLPRYYIPLNIRGRLGIKLNLYKEVKQLVPEALKVKLGALRERWYKRIARP